MKKIILFAAILAASAAVVSAQNKTKFGIRAGLNIANITEKANNGVSIDSKSKAGLHAGVAVEHGLGYDWFVESGLYYSGKGATFEMSKLSQGEVPDFKFNLHYLQLPLMAGYRFEASPRWAATFAAGGYAAYGFSGNMKAMGMKFDLFDKGIPMEYDDGYSMISKLKRFDVGLRFAVAAEFDGHYYFGVNCDLGLKNLNNSTLNGITTTGTDKTTNFGITVGYTF